METSNNNIQDLMDKNLWIDAIHALLDENYNSKASKASVWKSLIHSSEINLQLPDPQNTNVQFR